MCVMVLGVVRSVLLLITFVSYGKAEEHSSEVLECPGVCIHMDHTSCIPLLNHTDCGESFVCCSGNSTAGGTSGSSNFNWEGAFHEINSTVPVDSVESSDSGPAEGWGAFSDKTEFAAPDFFEENLSLKPHFLDLVENEATGSPLSTLVSEEPDVTLFPAEENILEVPEEITECPGLCMKDEYASYCQYVIPVPSLCEESKTCCITEREAHRISKLRREVPDEVFQRPNPMALFLHSDGSQCPGQCVHPSLTIFCEKVLNQYSCPIDSKCCIQKISSMIRPNVQPINKCTGQCLPNHIAHLCFKPYELISGTINCNRGTTCCMLSINAEEMPDRIHPTQSSIVHQPRQGYDVSDELENPEIQLAQDENGLLYHVDVNGQAKPIVQLPPALLHHGSLRLVTTVEKPEGRIFIIGDLSGNFYQQYESALVDYIVNDSLQPNEKHFESSFTKNEDTSGAVSAVEATEEMEDIIIPDEDDELPISDAETTTLPPTVKPTISPICPGSCTSYLLRLTCFGNYAIYDGFFCPGRSVCCASKKNIAEHEKYLNLSTPEGNINRSKGLSCGKKGQETRKDSIMPGEWCWQVAIINSLNQYICGGAIIDTLWVVTAAHCVSGFLNEQRTLFVRAGVLDLTSEIENAEAQTRRVLATYVHQNHNGMTLDNDIALLQLQNPFLLNSNVCTVCLPSKSELLPEGTVCTTTGYGFVSRSGSMSLKLDEAEVPLVHDMDCIANVTDALTSVFILPASSFCAGGHGRKDSCQADAGGPLVCKIDGVYELFGLVSWGLGCGVDEVPSIFVKIPAFVGWINQIINYNIYLKSMP